jgi:hypothetical protein
MEIPDRVVNAFGDLVQDRPPHCVAELGAGCVKAVVARESGEDSAELRCREKRPPAEIVASGQRIVATCAKSRRESGSDRRRLAVLERETAGVRLRATMGTS